MAFKNSYSLASKVVYLLSWSCDYHVTGLLHTHLQPTEYYDQRNADEERVGQVCMDDLASEGLLLIRMEPDDRGRYGFIVKVRSSRFALVTLTTLYLSTVRGWLAIPYRFFLLAVLSKLWLFILHCPTPLGWIWWRNGCLCHKGHFTISSESLHINSIMQSLWSDMYMYM